MYYQLYMYSVEKFSDNCRLYSTRVQELFETLTNLGENVDGSEVLELYNQLLIAAEQVSAPTNLLSNVHPDLEFRTVAEKFEQEMSSLMTEISMSRAVYNVLKKISLENLDSNARRFHEKLLRSFRRSGVDTDDTTRVRIAQLNDQLTKISQEFGKNIRDDVRTVYVSSEEELRGLPPDFIASHQPGSDGRRAITTDYPDLYPVMTFAENSALREELYLAFQTRGYPKNQDILKAMLQKRFELATLLGYKHWADYVAEEKMIKTGAAISAFVDSITTLSEKRAKDEYEMLLVKKRETDSLASDVQPWEKQFFEEKVRQEKFNFDSQSVRPYFEYDQTKVGLMKLASQLYGISFVPVVDKEVWHSSVEVYNVMRDEKIIGCIYLDMHPRENKYKHAAQFTLQSGVTDVQLPHGVLVCNFSDPTVVAPALLDHNQVTTFFHEFGHLLHHILGGDQKWIYFSGVATEWDFVEAPSQFFEEWAWNAPVLQTFACHIETQEPISVAMVSALRAADEFGKGLFVRRQMFYAALSICFYNENPKTFDIHKRTKELYKKYQPFPFIEKTYTELGFGHLDGYSAIYYTYMWSLVISKDLLTKFSDGDLLNTTTTQEYAQTILKPGGSKDAAVLISDFLKRPYSFDAFNKWLMQ